MKTEEIPAAPVEQAVTESAATDDAELVAAITAAVACCLGEVRMVSWFVPSGELEKDAADNAGTHIKIRRIYQCLDCLT